MVEDRFKSLLDTARVVNSSNDLAGTLEHIVVALCRSSVWSTSAIMVVDHAEQVTKRVARFDPSGREDGELRLSWDLRTSPARVVIETSTPIIIPDARYSADFPGYQADAAERGYRTVVVLPLNIRDEIGRPMVAAVQSKTVIQVDPSELSYLEAICELAAIAVRKIHVIRHERETAARLEFSARHGADLVELVLSNGKINSVLELAEELIGPHLSLVVVYGDVIYAGRAPAGVRFRNDEWRGAVSAGIRKDAAIRRLTRVERIIEPRTVTLNLPGRPEPIGGTVEALALEERMVGLLFALGARDPDPVTRILLTQTRFALSVAILREHVRVQSLNETRADILLALLTSETRDREALIERARRYGLDLDARHRLFAVLPSGVPRATGGSIDLQGINGPGSTGILAGSGQMNWILIAGDTAVATFAPRLEQVFSEHWGVAPVIAASDILTRAEDYPQAASRLKRVTEIALRFGRTGLVPERLSSSHLSLLAGLDPAEAREFVNRHIGRLSGDRDARATVRAYLARSGRLQAAADDLSVHVSTLRYRLEKIRDTLAIDLQTPEGRFNVELAIVLADLLGDAGDAHDPIL